MPLSSSALAGEPRLEACLVDDNAHLTPGSQGEPVALVQAAIMFLDGAEIEANELRTQSYGPSTAAAVLRFKTKRAIINRSYQQTADNIVGRMTIQAIDNELVIAENQRPSLDVNGVCSRPN